MKRLLSILSGALLLSATSTAWATGDRTPSSTSPPIIAWRTPAFYTPPHSGRTALTDAANPMPYIPLVPCRQYDSRSTTALSEATPRTVTLSGAPCGIPVSAVAVAVNITVFNITGAGSNGVFKVDTVSPPAIAWINYPPSETQRGNAGVLSLAADAIVVGVYQGGGSVDFTVDVFGYYAWTPANTANTFTMINPSGAGAPAILGIAGNGGTGVEGYATGSTGTGVYGYNDNASGWGVVGSSAAAIGVFGLSAANVGTKGKSTNSNGVWAESTNLDGLYALGGRFGTYSQGAQQGVVGVSTDTTGTTFGLNGAISSTTAGAAGVLGQATGGPPVNFAQNMGGTAGVLGVAKGATFAVVGVCNPAGWAGRFISQHPTTGNLSTEAYLAPSGSLAGSFFGNVNINAGFAGSGALGDLQVAGTLTKGFGSFKIDHPLDPENKYLYHSFVESPDMMNIYNGIVELDAAGEAIVTLPTYFEALNKDFRYQLTSIGQPQPNLYIADKIQNLQFRIAGGKPHAEASWQVTGVRQDPLANARRIIPEVEKEPEAKGYYLHPAAYKQPADKDLYRRLIEVEKAREIEKARNESQ